MVNWLWMTVFYSWRITALLQMKFLVWDLMADQAVSSASSITLNGEWIRCLRKKKILPRCYNMVEVQMNEKRALQEKASRAAPFCGTAVPSVSELFIGWFLHHHVCFIFMVVYKKRALRTATATSNSETIKVVVIVIFVLIMKRTWPIRQGSSSTLR
jgi:hypothetical protein